MNDTYDTGFNRIFVAIVKTREYCELVNLLSLGLGNLDWELEKHDEEQPQLTSSKF